MKQSSMRIMFCCLSLYSYMEAAAVTLPSHSDEPGQDANVAVRHGVLFQTNGCPQAVTSKEAQDIAANVPSPGNTITQLSQPGGRTGNRFEAMSQFFSMAYCCRSSLLVLPAHDQHMPTEDGSRWNSTRRWYDFSDAKMDLLPEFADLYDRPDVCLPERVQNGKDGYNLVGVHPDLQRCLNHVFVRGCEAAALGSVVNTTAFCSPKGDQTKETTPDDDDDDDDDHHHHHHYHRRLRTSKLETHGFQPRTARDIKPKLTGTGSRREGAGSLVIHIRSGDVFNPEGQGKRHPGFGQPPLGFFLDAIESKAWSDVSILTYALKPGLTNPTYKALGVLNDSGMLGPNVVLHHDRSLVEDLRTMLCADALAVARSSLHLLTFAHTRASTFYLPGSCGPGRYFRQLHVSAIPKRNPDNATLLMLEKPEAEVFGIEWETNRDSYHPYHSWADTDKQLLEMVIFDGVKRLKRCSITD